jgi:CRP-like cAMP-binding protein
MNSIGILDAYFRRNSDLKDDETDIICSYFREESLAREENLFREGDRYKKIAFVAKGILRVFVTDSDGEEIVKNFVEAESFFSDIESFDRNSPSVINVSAVTDCVLLTLSKPDAEILAERMPQWTYLMKMGAIQAMNDMIRKQNFLRIGNSIDKYNYFVKNFPVLAQQVPLKYIASFLSITQSSLSRIRKQG